MKELLRLLILLTLSTSGFCQASMDASYGMTNEQNKDWLINVSRADKDLQLRLVKGRLLQNRQTINLTNNEAVPVLIIDGIPIEDSFSEKQKAFLNTTLTVENVDIKVVEKEPDGLYINKGFTGMVLILITDKKTSKKFRRLK